jgi:hypothetical protein
MGLSVSAEEEDDDVSLLLRLRWAMEAIVSWFLGRMAGFVCSSALSIADLSNFIGNVWDRSRLTTLRGVADDIL